MKIAQKYSHLNGEEFLLVHHKNLYKEIREVVADVDAKEHMTKESGEKDRKGELVYGPSSLNQAFRDLLYPKGWAERRRNFFVSTDPNLVKQLEPLDFKQQKELLLSLNHPLYDSYNQTDFIKNKVALEVQLGKYFAVTYDLFVKHLSFFTGQLIDIGIEIVPTKKMQQHMSSGPPWFEKEVHNVLRHGRTNPPVPLLILGIEP